MKKTITKPDGTVTVYEGTVDEIKALELEKEPEKSDKASPWDSAKWFSNYKWPVCVKGCPVCFPTGAYWSILVPTCICVDDCFGKHQLSPYFAFFNPTVTYHELGKGILGTGASVPGTALMTGVSGTSGTHAPGSYVEPNTECGVIGCKDC